MAALIIEHVLTWGLSALYYKYNVMWVFRPLWVMIHYVCDKCGVWHEFCCILLCMMAISSAWSVIQHITERIYIKNSQAWSVMEKHPIRFYFCHEFAISLNFLFYMSWTLSIMHIKLIHDILYLTIWTTSLCDKPIIMFQ